MTSLFFLTYVFLSTTRRGPHFLFYEHVKIIAKNCWKILFIFLFGLSVHSSTRPLKPPKNNETQEEEENNVDKHLLCAPKNLFFFFFPFFFFTNFDIDNKHRPTYPVN